MRPEASRPHDLTPARGSEHPKRAALGRGGVRAVFILAAITLLTACAGGRSAAGEGSRAPETEARASGEATGAAEVTEADRDAEPPSEPVTETDRNAEPPSEPVTETDRDAEPPPEPVTETDRDAEPPSEPVTEAVMGDPAALEEMTGRLEDAPVEGWVLLFGDAALFSRPSDEAKLGRLASWEPSGRTAPDVRLMPARVVGEVGGYVMIESVTSREAQGHCGGRGVAALNRYRINALTPRSEISPVVTVSASQWFEDGTGVAAVAGVPIRLTTAGPVLHLSGGKIEAVLPEVALVDEVRRLEEAAPAPAPDGREGEPLRIGLSYDEPGREREPAGSVEPLEVVLRDVDWRVNGWPVHAEGSEWSWTDVLSVQPHWDGESGTLATVGTRCWTLTMVTEDERPTKARSAFTGNFGLGGIERAEGPFWRLRPATRAYWLDGTEAGRTLAEVAHRVEPRRVEREDGGDLLCFPLLGDVVICHEEGDVEAAGG